MPSAIKGSLIVNKEDNPRICMFCQNIIHSKKENCVWAEHYYKGKIVIARWYHLDCQSRFYQTKVLEKIRNRIGQATPELEEIIAKMLPSALKLEVLR